jgi:hypothetical protein
MGQMHLAQNKSHEKRGNPPKNRRVSTLKGEKHDFGAVFYPSSFSGFCSAK